MIFLDLLSYYLANLLGKKGYVVVVVVLSYYLANKWSLHVRSQGLEILTLIREK